MKRKKEFNVFCITSLEEDSKGYTHWADGLTMYIEKDGVSLKLNSDEIEDLVQSLPRTLGGAYR